MTDEVVRENDEEQAALVSADILAMIKAQDEKMHALEQRLQETQASKLRSLESRVLESETLLRKSALMDETLQPDLEVVQRSIRKLEKQVHSSEMSLGISPTTLASAKNSKPRVSFDEPSASETKGTNHESEARVFAPPKPDPSAMMFQVNSLAKRIAKTEHKIQRDVPGKLEETFPETTFSFFLVTRYPICGKPSDEMHSVDFSEEISLRTSNTWRKTHERDYLCIPYWGALFVVTAQLGIYTLALQNSIDLSNPQNPLQFPIDVDPWTSATELIAVIVAVYTQNNVFQGFTLFVQNFKHISEIPGTSIWKYYSAALSQVLVGFYGIFVTFIIIMQATDVVDLLLDFTAMEFVSALDDSAFLLCLSGFLGTPMKRTAVFLKGARYIPQDKRKWLRKWPLLFLSVVLLCFYVIIRLNQENRVYGDNELYVQFHDNVIPWLSVMSGPYIGCHANNDDRSDLSIGPIVYSKHQLDGCANNWKAEQGAFVFCEPAWVFAAGEGMKDPCNMWTMKSFKPDVTTSDRYDLLAHSAASWFARDTNQVAVGGDGVTDDLFIQPYQLSSPLGQGGCDILEAEGIAFSDPFYYRVEDVLVNGRPVFRSNNADDTDFLFFNGRRWIAIQQKDLRLECLPDCEIEDNLKAKSCYAACLKTFDLFLSNYTVRIISDPMDLRTAGDTWIPTKDLTWYKATGQNKSATPTEGLKSLGKAFSQLESVLSAVRRKQATDAQLFEAEAFFAQSSTLTCLCRENEERCKDEVECPGGVPLWVDLYTDAFPQETFFFLAEFNSWSNVLAEAASVVEFGPWFREGGYNENFRTLNETGYFEWQNARSDNFIETNSVYRYTTCMPKDACGVIHMNDTSADGLFFPGGFAVYYDRKRIPIDDDQISIKYCSYQFGSCDQVASCPNKVFEVPYNPPGVQCEEGTPMSFRLKTDKYANENSFVLMDRDSFLNNQTAQLASAEIRSESGHFEWQNSISPAMRNFRSYAYSTCVPDQICAVMLLQDVYGDGFFNSGSFDLSFNRTTIFEIDPTRNFERCIIQFGSCEEQVMCLDR